MSLSEYQLRIDTTGLVMGAGTDYIVHSWEGLGLPGVRDSDREVPFDHGIFQGPEYVEPRTVSIDMTIRGVDANDCQSNVDALIKAWYFDARAASTYNKGSILSVRQPGQVERLLYGRPRRLTIDHSRIIAGNATATAEFLSRDPRWYSSTLNSSVLGLASVSSGFSWDKSFDFGFGGGSSNAVNCVNAGSFNSIPSLRLDGPLTNVTVTNETTGKSIVITYTLAGGEYLELDFQQRTVLLGGTASRYYAKSGDWWDLIPGTNSIRLNASSGSGTATLSWRDAWL